MSAFPMCQVEEQLIWEDGAVKDGVVQITGGPDRVKNPVVMSNASRFPSSARFKTRHFLQKLSAGDSWDLRFWCNPPFFCWWDQILWIQPFPRVGSCFSRSQEFNKPCHPRPSRASWCNPMSWGTFTIRRCEVKKTPAPYLGGRWLSSGRLFWENLTEKTGSQAI